MLGAAPVNFINVSITTTKKSKDQFFIAKLSQQKTQKIYK